MRGYFFHIGFELSPTGSKEGPTDKHQLLYPPPPGTDIFGDKLPAHRSLSWGTQLDQITSAPLAEKSSTSDTQASKHHSRAESQHLEGGRASPSQDWRFDAVSIISI